MKTLKCIVKDYRKSKKNVCIRLRVVFFFFIPYKFSCSKHQNMSNVIYSQVFKLKLYNTHILLCRYIGVVYKYYFDLLINCYLTIVSKNSNILIKYTYVICDIDLLLLLLSMLGFLCIKSTYLHNIISNIVSYLLM